MKNRLGALLLFINGLVCFLIFIKLFYNVFIFCDQNNSTPQIVYGGNQYLILAWINIIMLLVLCVCLFIKTIRKE